MNIKRLGVAVAVLNGYLYAVGGSDGQTPWNLVERYDPKENRWSEVAPMSTRRKHLGCAIYRVNILFYIIDHSSVLDLCSVSTASLLHCILHPKTSVKIILAGIGFE